MATKFAEFLDKSKLAPRRIRAASRVIERLRPEDRAIRLAKRNSKGADAPPPAEGEEAAVPKKPRSRRVVTDRLLTNATEGKAITGAAKTRLLRAVNRLLEQKKKDPVELKALF